MKMGSEKYKLKWSKYETNILSAFHGLLESETLSDVTLFCEGQTFKAHRLVLAACSIHFESLFSNSPPNVPMNNQLFVILDGTRADDLQILLHFMYRGEAYLHHDRINSVLKTAEVLQVKGLSEGPRNIELNQNHSLGRDRGSWSPISSPPLRKKINESPLPPERRNVSPSPGLGSPTYYPSTTREQFPMYRLPPFPRPLETSSSFSPRYRKQSTGPGSPPPKRDEKYEAHRRSSDLEVRPPSNKTDYEENVHKGGPFPSDSTTTDLPSSTPIHMSYKEERIQTGDGEGDIPKFSPFHQSREDLTAISNSTPSPVSRNSGLNDEDVRTAANNLETFRRLAQQHARANLPNIPLSGSGIPASLSQGFSASDYVRLATHVREPDNGDPCTGSGTKLRCPFCERTYGYETNLRAHIRQRHQGIRVSCPYCPRTFTRNNTVRRHVAREHRHLSRNIPTRFASTRIPPDSLSSQQMAAAVAAAANLSPPEMTPTK